MTLIFAFLFQIIEAAFFVPWAQNLLFFCPWKLPRNLPYFSHFPVFSCTISAYFFHSRRPHNPLPLALFRTLGGGALIWILPSLISDIIFSSTTHSLPSEAGGVRRNLAELVRWPKSWIWMPRSLQGMCGPHGPRAPFFASRGDTTDFPQPTLPLTVRAIDWSHVVPCRSNSISCVPHFSFQQIIWRFFFCGVRALCWTSRNAQRSSMLRSYSNFWLSSHKTRSAIPCLPPKFYVTNF